MAKYQAYAEYKDSGVEWLGEVPNDWDILSIARVSNKITNGYVGATRDIFFDSGIRYLQSLHIKNNNINFHTPYYVSESWSNEKSKSILKEGDVLIVQTGDIGQVAAVTKEFEGCNCHALIIVSGTEKISGFYLAWLLNSNYGRQTLKSIQTGALHPHLNCGAIKDIKIPLPDIDIQNKITSFLDHETTKIDHLIEKQQQLIELLKEKRQAVISHAVTKGLDPNVPMKDSGVAWLGEVPEHWQLVPLKYLCTFSGGGTPTKDNLSYWTDGNIPWVSPKDMKTFWISKTQDYITEKAVKESSTNTVEQNSLLMVVRSGILQRTIPIAINTVPVTMNQDMKALKFGKRVLVEYIANLIHGNTVQLLLEWSKEGATVESIEHEYLANSLIPVPSLKEQEEITQVIAKKMKVYAELTEKAELQITLLQERRTTLISAAVTGKIDVRHWQAPTVAEADTELSA